MNGSCEALHGLLSPEEQARARQFQFTVHRLRFIACRAQLRILLAYYTAGDARQITFVTNRHGKPALGGDLASSGIHFNVSHSENLAVLAFGLGRHIGVDVELARPAEWLDQVALSHFSADEYRFYAAAHPTYRYQVFFSCWTRKEAYLKAIGKGLSFPLNQVNVELHKTRSVMVSKNDAQRWSIQTFTPALGYVGAMVAEGEDCTAVYLSETDLPHSVLAVHGVEHGHITMLGN